MGPIKDINEEWFAGMLEMALSFLPTNSNWNHYKRQSDDASEELAEETARVLAQQAKETCQLLVNDESYKQDLWMWDQDWDIKQLKVKKSNAVVNHPKSVVQQEEVDILNMQKLAPHIADVYWKRKQ